MPRTLRGMDALIDPTTRDYAGRRTQTLANAVYLRLATPLGSYWADPTLGSKLHTLKREKDTARVAVLARQYAGQALAPLLDDGRAEQVSVTTTRRAPGWLDLHVQVVDATGQEQTFQHPVRVV